MNLKKLFYNFMFNDIRFYSVLDVASGNGRVMDYFKNKGIEAKAIDLYPVRNDIRKMDAENLVFNSNSFGLVYCSHFLEHLKEPLMVARELNRVSSDYVFVMCPSPSRSFWDQPDHIRPYTSETLVRLFKLNRCVKRFDIYIPFFTSFCCVLYRKRDSRLTNESG